MFPVITMPTMVIVSMKVTVKAIQVIDLSAYMSSLRDFGESPLDFAHRLSPGRRQNLWIFDHVSEYTLFFTKK